MADLAAIANANADLRFKPQESAIQRKLQELGATTTANEGAINNYGTRGKEALGQVYDLLDTSLGQNRTQNMAALNQQVANTGRAYDEAEQVQKAALNQSRLDMQKMMGQMGGGVGLDLSEFARAQSGTEQTVADILGRNAKAKVGTTGDLGAWASKHDAVLGQGQDIAKQMRANKLSDLESELLRGLSDNRYQGLKGTNELNANLSDILNERGSFLTSEMARLAAEEWERQMQQQQLAQQAAIAQAELDARASALASERASRSRDYSREDARQALLDARYADETKYDRSQDALAQRNWEKQHGNAAAEELAKKQQLARSEIADAYYSNLNNPEIAGKDKGLMQLRQQMIDNGLYGASGIDPNNDPVYRRTLGSTPTGAGINATGQNMRDLFMKSLGQGQASSPYYIRSGQSRSLQRGTEAQAAAQNKGIGGRFAQLVDPRALAFWNR